MLPLVATAAAAFIAMCLGAYVSSSGAGLACLGFPTCGDTTSLGAPQIAQMLHRLAAGLVAIGATIALARVFGGATSRRLRLMTALGYGLLLVQIALGAANVRWLLPLGLREAHAANAGATFIAFIIALVIAWIDAPLNAADSLRSRRHHTSGARHAERVAIRSSAAPQR